MTRDEMKRMLSQVDERYIAELDESTAEDAESEVFEVHPETKRSFWRIPAAIAAAVLIGLIPAVSLFSGRDLPPEPETSAGSSEETLHTGTPVDRMTDEEVNACFTMEYLTSRPGGTMVDGTASIELCGQTLEVKQFWSNGTNSDLSYITGAELRSTATDLIVTIDVGFSEDSVVCAQDSLLPAPEYAHPGGYAIDFVGRYEEETGFASCDFYANGVHYSLESAQMTRRELLAMAFTLAGQHIPANIGNRELWELYYPEEADEQTVYAGFVPVLYEVGDLHLTGQLACDRAYLGGKPMLKARYESYDHTRYMQVTWKPFDSEYSVAYEPKPTDLGDGLYQYHKVWNESTEHCTVTVDAVCTEEELETYCGQLTEKMAEAAAFEPKEVTLAEANAVPICAGLVPQTESIGGMTLRECDTLGKTTVYLRYDADEAHHLDLHYSTAPVPIVVSTFHPDWDYGYMYGGKQYPPELNFDSLSMETIMDGATVNTSENGRSSFVFCTYRGDCCLTVAADCLPEEMETFLHLLKHEEDTANEAPAYTQETEAVTLAEANAVPICAGLVPQTETIGEMTLNQCTIYDPDTVHVLWRAPDETHYLSAHFALSPIPCMQTSGSENRELDGAMQDPKEIGFASLSMETIRKQGIAKPTENGRTYYLFCTYIGDCCLTVAADCLPEEMRTFLHLLKGEPLPETAYEAPAFKQESEELTLAEANTLDFCKGLVPQTAAIGGMALDECRRDYTNTNDAARTVTTDYLTLNYDGGDRHFLMAVYSGQLTFPILYGGTREDWMVQFPEIASPDMETVTAGGNNWETHDGQRFYQFRANVSGCWVVVYANCLPEELETFLQSLHTKETAEEALISASSVFRTWDDVCAAAPAFTDYLPRTNTVGSLALMNLEKNTMSVPHGKYSSDYDELTLYYTGEDAGLTVTFSTYIMPEKSGKRLVPFETLPEGLTEDCYICYPTLCVHIQAENAPEAPQQYAALLQAQYNRGRSTETVYTDLGEALKTAREFWNVPRSETIGSLELVPKIVCREHVQIGDTIDTQTATLRFVNPEDPTQYVTMVLVADMQTTDIDPADFPDLTETPQIGGAAGCYVIYNSHDLTAEDTMQLGEWFRWACTIVD